MRYTLVATATTDVRGGYRVDDPVPDPFEGHSYVVQFVDPTGVRASVFHGDSPAWDSATPVHLDSVPRATGVDAVLRPAGRIAGRVHPSRSAATVHVGRSPRPGRWETVEQVRPDADGHWSVAVEPGTYGVFVTHRSARGGESAPAWFAGEVVVAEGLVTRDVDVAADGDGLATRAYSPVLIRLADDPAR